MGHSLLYGTIINDIAQTEWLILRLKTQPLGLQMAQELRAFCFSRGPEFSSWDPIRWLTNSSIGPDAYYAHPQVPAHRYIYTCMHTHKHMHITWINYLIKNLFLKNSSWFMLSCLLTGKAPENRTMLRQR